MGTVTRIGLLVLHGFVAVSAIAGAIWVVPTMPLDWIRSGPFTDWTVPAIALGFVGVLAAIAFVLVLVRPWVGALASMVAGLAMIVFELVEIAVVGWTLSIYGTDMPQAWLQLVYLVVGSAQLLLGAIYWRSVREEAPPIPILHPAAT